MRSSESSLPSSQLGRRAIFLTQTFPRFPTDTAGPFIREIALGLVRAGWQVRVLTPHMAGLAPQWQDEGLSVQTFRYAPERLEVLGYSRSLEKDESIRLGAGLVTPSYLWCARRALERALLEHHADVVHAHWIVPNGLAAAPSRSRHNGQDEPVRGYGLHGSDVFLAEKPMIRWLVAALLSRGDFLTGCSPELVRRVAALRPGAIAEATIPYGVDSEQFRPDEGNRAQWRQRLGLSPESTVILGVGRMATKKGFQVLMAQLDGLFTGASGDVHLVLAGGGDREDEFRAQSRDWADRVHFPGLIERDALPGLYAAADIFVLPAVHDEKGNVDGLPNVILEAMASGLPVVASAISGIPLAVETETTGILVEEGRGSQVVQALHRLLHDPELRRQMGAAARQRVVAELTWDRVAGRYAEVYEQAQRRRHARASGR